MYEQSEQPVEKKARIDDQNQEQTEDAKLASSTDESNKELTISTTVDLPYRLTTISLPMELNCEVFKCLKLPIQKKFISGLGFYIYSIFYHKLLTKTRRVRNPEANKWEGFDTMDARFLDERPDTFETGTNPLWLLRTFAQRPFPVGGQCPRWDDFPGTIIYYYEVKVTLLKRTGKFCIGLSDDAAIPEDYPKLALVGNYPNSYAITQIHFLAAK